MSAWFEMLLRGVLVTLGVSAVFSLYRLVRGPSLPDRVVAMDLISLQFVGAIAAYAVLIDVPGLLNVAMVLAIISSLSTIAIARYLFTADTGDGGEEEES
ncbi:cation:proton antiporter [Archangium sp. Cb G35]|uniref:monovalent cation/H+ antiporter complex subunit F n=1 Tax=Archangium sp. Cb G35 TaxID=1920190 RepID=UPI000936BB07|nr:monovalent cation/H+ antiporter complex subunit F [Archangium sp. Cb G35]OJT26702.1 cation:proton antiporter [Archangium sp. Cb G35]